MGLKRDTGRREFLAAVTASGAVALGLGVSDAMAEGGAARSELGGQGKGGSDKGEPVELRSLYDTSTRATGLTGEAADRLAIRRLVDAWAHCADRRLAREQSELFVPDGTVVNYDGDPATHAPNATLRGRAEIFKALAVLNTFTATTHINGQSDVVLSGDKAAGENYCIAYELSMENGQRKLQTLAIRYHDKFVRQADRWYFAERSVIIDWKDGRMSTE